MTLSAEDRALLRSNPSAASAAVREGPPREPSGWVDLSRIRREVEAFPVARKAINRGGLGGLAPQPSCPVIAS